MTVPRTGRGSWSARPTRAAILALSLGLVAASCGEGNASGRRVELVVSAAASLTDAFGALADAFEGTHEDIDVILNIGGSAGLREQIREGAPVDVFAAADPSHVQAAIDARGGTGQPKIFARSRLRVAVPAGNPGQVRGLVSFADPDLLLGLCAAEVPCGMLARRALARAEVTPVIDTNEPDVRALLTRIAQGELDAGIVYVTDLMAAGPDVEGIVIPADQNAVAAYSVIQLQDSASPDAAAELVRFVLAEEGQRILREHGFGPP